MRHQLDKNDEDERDPEACLQKLRVPERLLLDDDIQEHEGVPDQTELLEADLKV